MYFAQALLLAVVCLFSISGFVQESSARDVQLRSGRNLANLNLHSDVSAEDTDDNNEGNEGDEGNEGSVEGDEGNGLDGDTSFETSDGTLSIPDDGGPDDGGPDDGGPDDGGPDDGGPDDGGPDDGGPDDGGPDDGGPDDGAAVDTADEDVPEDVPEDTAEDVPEDVPEEEEDVDGTGAAAAAGAGAAAVGGAVVAGSGGDAPEEADAMAPEVVPGDALAPGPVGDRDFDFAEGPAQCSTLRDGLMNASPILQTALEAIAPLGDPGTLGSALDDPTVNVTVLLPDEEILQQVATALTTGTAGVDAAAVQEILLDHILAEPLEAAELIELGDGPVLLVTGEDIELMIEGSNVLFELNNITAMVTTPDLDGCAGESIIHRIDNIFTILPEVAPVDTTDRGTVDETEEEEGAAPFLSVLAPAAGTALAAVMLLL